MADHILVQKDFNNIPLLNLVLQQLASDPTDIEAKLYYNTGSKVIRFYNGTSWEDIGGSGVTNLTFSRDGITVTIESSTGADAIIPIATGALAGMLSAADKTKLDGIDTGATDDQTGAEIKTALEGESDTNTVTDSEKTAIGNLSGTNSGDEPDASTTVKGIIEIATQAEVNAGSDAVKSVAPDTLAVYVAAEIATAVTNGMDFKGDYNASTNSPDLDTAPSGIKIGDTYAVTAAGTFFTEDLEIGDILIAKQDDPTTLAHWSRIQYNLTAATIKTQYESNSDTNALTDAYVTLLGNLSGINSGDEPDASTTVKGIVELATNTETNTGTDAVKAVTPAGLQNKLGTSATLDNVVRYETTIGNGAAVDFTITHNIGRQFVKAVCIRNSSPWDEVDVKVECDSTTACGITGFIVAPTTDEFKVVVYG